MSKNSKHNRKGYRRSPGKSFFDFCLVAALFMGTGYILGILFAPSSGLKTRKKWMDVIREILDRGKFAFEEVRVMGEELIEKSIEKVGEASGKTKN